MRKIVPSRDARRGRPTATRPPWALVVATALIPPGWAAADVEQPPPGAAAEVVLKPGVAVPGGGRGGAYRYRVERIEGDRLWLSADGACGWVNDSDVVPAAEAVRYYTRAIRADPSASWAYARRALAWYDRDELEIAIADLTDAIALDPSDALSHSNRGLARLEKREYAAAIADFNEAIRLDPEDAASFRHRGLARAAGKDDDRAIADFSEAIRLDPEDAATYRERGLAAARRRRFDRAAVDLDEAVRRDPKDAWACNGLAWLLATCPDAARRDGGRAVALARRANELTRWEGPYHLGTLAAASAEAGDFDAAVAWQAKALALFPNDDPEREAHRARLARYRSKTPYREGTPLP